MTLNHQDLRTESITSKPLILTGFATILFILALIIGFWFKSISDNKDLLQEMADENVETRLISQLINTTQQQSMILNALLTASNQQEKQESYKNFLFNKNVINELNTQLSTSNMEGEERSIWLQTEKLLRSLSLADDNAIETFQNGNTDTPYTLPIDQIVIKKIQSINELSKLLNGLLSRSSTKVVSIIEEAENKNGTTYILVLLLSGVAVFLGLFTILITKKTSRTESQLIDQGKRIQLLYEATSNSGLSLDDRITETLKLGCRVLGMEIGKLGCQDPENNTSTFLNTIAPPELPAKRGLVLPLDKTFCNITFSADGPIAIHHVSTSSYKNHPAAAFLGMEAYLGTTIYVHDKKFGTVNFSNRKPMDRPFNQADINFVNLLGKWISVTMEQIISEEELQKSKNEAEAANQAKTTFLANMSHEIRTPLTAILGYSEMLMDEDQSQQDMEHEIKSIIASGSHLQQIINDILDLSKIEAGQLIIEHREISPLKFAEEINVIIGSQALDKGLTFNIEHQFPLPETIQTDPTRLKQILINLCGNAIKFTHEGNVTVSLKYNPDDNQLIIIVSDTGIGLTDDEQEKLFKPFSQADESTTRIYGGTGLGLCIAKQLSQKLGGDISVISEKGKGSQFTVRIDVGIEPSQLNMITATQDNDHNIEETPSHNTINLSGHVLLVEDNIDNQALITKYIKKLGLTVDTANNGQEAIDKISGQSYDLILMDIQMPVMDGLEAIRRLRVAGNKTPIISLTANAMQEDRKKCFDAGADDYLSKPINFTRFHAVLSQYLST
jgi:signal transduction histidine kinase